MRYAQHPFAPSLSKGCFSFWYDAQNEGQGFDRLSPNGAGNVKL